MNILKIWLFYLVKSFQFLILLTLVMGCKPDKPQEEEKWTSLFNGKDLSGWTPKISGFPLGENYKNTFMVKDSLLLVNYAQYDTFAGEFGHLFYEKPYSSYKLRTEYKFFGKQLEGGAGWANRNNGVMFHCQDPATMNLDQDFPVCLEFQFLGGNGPQSRPTCNLCTPGTNVYMNDSLEARHCINSVSATYHGDQWVSAELVVYGDSIIHHMVNGQVVMTYTKPHIGGGHLPENFPLKEGTPMSSGYIAIQAETHSIAFRRIDIIEL